MGLAVLPPRVARSNKVQIWRLVIELLPSVSSRMETLRLEKGLINRTDAWGGRGQTCFDGKYLYLGSICKELIARGMGLWTCFS